MFDSLSWTSVLTGAQANAAQQAKTVYNCFPAPVPAWHVRVTGTTKAFGWNFHADVLIADPGLALAAHANCTTGASPESISNEVTTVTNTSHACVPVSTTDYSNCEAYLPYDINQAPFPLARTQACDKNLYSSLQT